MNTHSKLLALLASAGLALGLAGCAGSADGKKAGDGAKDVSVSQLDKQKQEAEAKAKAKAEKEAKDKAEAEAKAKAEADAKAKAEAETKAKAEKEAKAKGSSKDKVSVKSKPKSQAKPKAKTRSKTVKSNKPRSNTRRSGGGGDLGWDPSKGTVQQDIERNRATTPPDKPGTCTMLGGKVLGCN